MMNVGKRSLLWLMLGWMTVTHMHTATAGEYVFQSGRFLANQVDGQTSLTKDYTVNEQGDITLDTVGKVHVAGLTVKGSEEELSKQLKKYYKLFEVHVSISGETGGRVL